MAVSEQRIDCEFKVVLIGDFVIGKCQTLAPNECEKPMNGTPVTVKYETQTLHIEKKSVKAHIWGIIPTKLNNIDLNTDYADGVILVYDITKSFDCIKPFLEELRRHAKKRQAIILIGNKSDSKKDLKVQREKAHVFAKENSLIFREMSALEGTDFDNAFKDLLTQLVNNTATNTGIGTGTGTNTTTTTTTSTTNDNTNTWNLNVNVNVGK